MNIVVYISVDYVVPRVSLFIGMPGYVTEFWLCKILENILTVTVLWCLRKVQATDVLFNQRYKSTSQN